MNFDDGAVDHGEFHIGIVRHRIENPLEDIGRYPVAETLEDRVPLAKGRWQVSPGTAGPRDPQNGLQEQPVVAAAASGIGRLAQAMRLHLCPLSVRQIRANHPKLHFWSLNHALPAM